MLLIALGYNADRENFGGANWDTNVNVVATAKGVYDEVEDIDPSVALTRDDAAQMIWNTLQAYEVEYKTTLVTDANGQLITQVTVQDKVVGDNYDKITLLKDKYEVSKYEGVVLANEYGALDEDVQKEGKTFLDVTAIDGEDISDSGFDGTYAMSTDMDMLGKTVIFFAKDKKNIIGNVVVSQDNAVVTTTEKQINKDLVDLLDEADLKLGATNTKVSENYAVASDKSSTAIDNAAGVSMTAIDNNDDGVVDYIIKVEYKLGKVTKYSTDKKGSITVNAGAAGITKNNADDVIGFEDVAKNDYVLYAEIGGKLYVEKAESVTGKLTAYNTGKSLTIDGTKYTVSGVGFYADGGKLETANGYDALDAKAVFYLDKHNNVVAVGDTEDVANNNYAFLISAQNVTDDNLDTVLRAKVLLDDGTIATYNVEDADDTDNEAKANDKNQLMTYSFNGDDEIILEKLSYVESDNQAIKITKGKISATVAGANAVLNNETVFFYITAKGDYVANSSDNTIPAAVHAIPDLSIDSANVYVGKDNVPSLDDTTDYIAIKDDNTVKAVFAVVDSLGAADEVIYLYEQTGTSSDGTTWNAILNGELVEDVVVTNSAQEGLYKYTTNDKGYKVTAAGATTDVVSTLDGNAVIINGKEYVLTDDTNVALIDGEDTEVGYTLEEGDYVVFTADEEELTNVFILEEYDDEALSVYLNDTFTESDDLKISIESDKIVLRGDDADATTGNALIGYLAANDDKANISCTQTTEVVTKDDTVKVTSDAGQTFKTYTIEIAQ